MVENLGWKKQTILKAVKLTQSACGEGIC